MSNIPLPGTPPTAAVRVSRFGVVCKCQHLLLYDNTIVGSGLVCSRRVWIDRPTHPSIQLEIAGAFWGLELGKNVMDHGIGHINYHNRRYNSSLGQGMGDTR